MLPDISIVIGLVLLVITPARAEQQDAQVAAPLDAPTVVEQAERDATLAATGQPRKMFLTLNKAGRHRKYVNACLDHVVAHFNVHDSGRAVGKRHGTGYATFEIDAEGRVLAVMLDKTTGHAVLDRSFLDAVRAAAPYPPFPAALRRETDILSITTHFEFSTRDDDASPTPTQKRK